MIESHYSRLLHVVVFDLHKSLPLASVCDVLTWSAAFCHFKHCLNRYRVLRVELSFAWILSEALAAPRKDVVIAFHLCSPSWHGRGSYCSCASSDICMRTITCTFHYDCYLARAVQVHDLAKWSVETCGDWHPASNVFS